MEGNQMKMREALVEAIGETCAECSRDCDDCMNLKSGWMKKAKAALSAPPRQCDVGTAEEQAERFHAFCNKGKLPQFAESAYCAHECSCRDAADCKFAWAQTPYAEEGGDHVAD